MVVEMLLVSAIGIRKRVVCELKVPRSYVLFSNDFFLCVLELIEDEEWSSSQPQWVRLVLLINNPFAPVGPISLLSTQG